MNEHDEEITVASLYKKLIILETKMDAQELKSSKTTARFTRFVLVLGTLMLLDILSNILVHSYFFHLGL